MRKGWPSLALLILLAQPVAAQGLKIDAAIVLAGQGADFWSTQDALGRGGREMVGPSAMGGVYGRAALKVGLSAGVLALCHERRKHGHPNQARLLAVLAGIGGAVPAIINMRR
jgi:hypothetical protein